MMRAMACDAVVVGAGPNGLVAATVLARAGWSVEVLEQAPTAGGAVRSEERTLPGYVHDTMSAFYGLLHASPVFDELELARRVDWARFDTPAGAAVGPENAAVIRAGVADTADGLGEDGEAWVALSRWWVTVGWRLLDVLLSPVGSLRPLARLIASSGGRGSLDVARMLLSPVEAIARDRFVTERAATLLASGACHGDVSVDAAGSSPSALTLAMVAQYVGMPVPVGGAGRLADALVGALVDAGGSLRTGARVTRVVTEAGRAVGVETTAGPMRARRAVLADTDVVTLCRDLLAPGSLPGAFYEGLRRYRRSTGMFRLDLALDGPATWTAEELRTCGVVHLTGTLASMARAADDARHGRLPERPMLIVGQQSLVDESRAPPGGHTLWIETHVPSRPSGGWRRAAARFEARVLDRLEAHAPGLSARIVGHARLTPEDLERVDPNLVGGDIGGGTMALDQQLVFRPVPGWFRYRLPVRGLYLCSASAHPGGGVHGMAGRNCARRVQHDARVGCLRARRR